ncbi:hypothetical protein HN832_04615 [archaeon]|jgi:ribosomal protein S15P/S13E|nr:hypothetical protein [archaeon]MBT4373965.1 hypothetical protein [archaeon]MBT4532194.1 hypothetical protein [archaeon]MBT7001951.1 hypothetical protein [archaeon]MBT7282668.1 hypothetical protein [archaeon]
MTEKKKPKEEKTEKKEKSTVKTKKITQAEFEKKVIKLADEGLTSEKIGEKLRQEGIHSNDFKKKISQILKEKEKYVNPDLKNVEAKLEKIKTHFGSNKQDKRAKREKDRFFSQLRKLKIYHKVE